MVSRSFTIVDMAIAAVVPLLGGCEDTATALQRGEPPAIVLSQVRLETYGPEGSTGVTTTRKVTYLRDTGALEGENVVLDLPPTRRVGRGGVVLETPRARGDLKKRIASATGGVTAVTGEGDAARTEEANYDGATGTVSADTSVHVEGRGYSLDAGRYVFHVEENRLELQGRVIARSTPDNEPGATGGDR